MGRHFDSQGFLGPIMITPKLILQALHRDRVPWGAPIPLAVEEKLLQWYNELPLIQAVRIKRWIDFKEMVAFHGYADASEVAYGAVVYAERKDRQDLMLVASKSRIAPLKTLSTPRLELGAELLLANLMKSVVEALEVKVCVKLWSDSTVCLDWFRSTSLLKVFVHNRVQKIKEVTTSWKWNQVKGEDNPADILSRGLMPREIEGCDLWWGVANTGELVLSKEDKVLVAQEVRAKQCVYQRVMALSMIVADKEGFLVGFDFIFEAIGD